MGDLFIKIMEILKDQEAGMVLLGLIIFLIVVVAGTVALKQSPTKEGEGEGKSKPSLIKKMHMMFKPRKERERDKINASSFKDVLMREHALIVMNTLTEQTEPDKRVQYVPSRMIYFNYHNGGHYVGGESMVRMSARVQASNISSNLTFGDMDLSKHQDMMRSHFPFLINELFVNEDVCILDITKIKALDTNLYTFLANCSIKACYIARLYKQAKAPEGFVIIGFVEKADEPSQSRRNAKKLVEVLQADMKLSTMILLDKLDSRKSEAGSCTT